MARLRQHPPAWYPDPHAPSHQLRRWDGDAWTDDVRPLPDVLRTLRLSSGPGSPRAVLGALNSAYRVERAQNPSRGLWLASGMCLVVALTALVLTGIPTSRSPEMVADEEFLRRAAEECAAVDAAAVRPTDDDPDAHHELVDAHEDLVRELRRIPVALSYQSTVDRWLAAWDSWTTSGRRHAQALEAGDGSAAEDASKASADAMAVVRNFAYANDVPDYVMLQRR